MSQPIISVWSNNPIRDKVQSTRYKDILEVTYDPGCKKNLTHLNKLRRSIANDSNGSEGIFFQKKGSHPWEKIGEIMWFEVKEKNKNADGTPKFVTLYVKEERQTFTTWKLEVVRRLELTGEGGMGNWNCGVWGLVKIA